MNIIKSLAEKCADKLSSDYESYILENLGESIEVVKHDGCILDLDRILLLKEIMGISISWEVYQFIDGYFDDEDLLEFAANDKEELLRVLDGYIS